MKTITHKIIRLFLVVALLGAGVFYFAQNEQNLRAWLPFYGVWSGRTQSELLDIPIDDKPRVTWPADASGSGVAQPAGTVGESGIPVLLYHGILDTIVPEDTANISTRAFAEQMKMLKDEGYTAINARDLWGSLSGQNGLPAKPILITFDDGRIDSVKNGDPILRQYGFKAVMFVPVNKQNNKDKFFLSWDNLRDMQKSGRWDIQVHGGDRYHTGVAIDQSGTVDHFASNKEWLAQKGRLETDEEYGQRLLEDAKKGKSDLEWHLPGVELVAFAFPYGDYGQSAVNLPAETAIRKNREAVEDIFPISFGFVGSYAEGRDFDFFLRKGADSHLIQRLDVKGALSTETLRNLLRVNAGKKLPLVVSRFDQSLMESVIAVRGDAGLGDGSLDLRAPFGEEGAIAIVAGTNWADYRFEADITLRAGQTGFLLSRYEDGGNYLLCGLDGQDVSFRQMVGGSSILIAAEPYVGKAADYHIAVETIGTIASCSVNGVTAGRYHIDSALDAGGIGFKAWDPAAGKSEMAVRGLSVTPSRAIKYGYAALEADGAAIDIFAPTWYRFDEGGNILLNEAGMNFVRTKNDDQSSVFPRIGNRYAGTDAGSQTLIHAVLTSGAAAEKAIDNVVTLMLDRGFTGVSLDIDNVAAGDKEAYADFIRRLSERMHAHHLILVVDLSPKAGGDDAQRLAGIDREKIGRYADLVISGASR